MQRPTKLAVFHIDTDTTNKKAIKLKVSIPYISKYRDFYIPHSTFDAARKGIYSILGDVAKQIERPHGIISSSRKWEKSVGISHSSLERPARSIMDNARELLYEITDNLSLADFIGWFHQHKAIIENIKIVTNKIVMPWEFLCIRSKEEKRKIYLLCEEFSVGVSLQAEDYVQKQFGLFEPELKLKPEDTYGIIICSTYRNSDDPMYSELEYASDEADVIKGLLEKSRVNVLIIKDSNRSKIMKIIKEYRDSVKVIHFIGHFNSKGYVTCESETIKSWNISSLFKENEKFRSRPLIFLHGCSSNDEMIKPIKNRRTPYETGVSEIVSEFMTRGASGCIVTSIDIADAIAMRMAKQFYNNLFGKNYSIGMALKEAKNKTFQETQCAQPFFYHLMGSPQSELFT